MARASGTRADGTRAPQRPAQDEPLPLWWRVFAFVWLRVSFAAAAFGAVLVGILVMLLALQLPGSTNMRVAGFLATIATGPIVFMWTKRRLERWYERMRRQLEGTEEGPPQLGSAGASMPVGVSARPPDERPADRA